MLRLTIAGALLLSPAVAMAQAPRGPLPGNDRTMWITRGDYPLGEYAKGVEGVTGFVVSVGADGRPKGCQIARSSGSAILDNTVCRLVTARAKFRAARDASGQRVPGRYHNRVHWIIPPEQWAEMKDSAAKAAAAGQRIR